MLIIDYSQLAIASYMAVAFGPYGDDGVDLEFIRHVTLDGIRFVNSKFKRRFGNPVFAIDSKLGSWRKDVFPYYKAQRSKDRKESKFDWVELLQHVDAVKRELIEFFPYKIIEVDKAEADDIIGVLTRKAVSENEEVMIVSGDKDFIQLQINNNLVQQWDKRLDRYIGAEDPSRYLFEHVLKGDRGDGIPNILSRGDSFVSGTRQKPLRQERIDSYWENPKLINEDEAIKERFETNKQIIALRYTPQHLQEQILQMYNDYQINNRANLANYFIEKRMKKLYESIGDF